MINEQLDSAEGQASAEAPLCLWMPGLFGTGRAATALEQLWPGVKRLWPGLPAALARAVSCGPGKDGLSSLDFERRAFVPAELPCTPQWMGACLEDLDRFLRESARGTGCAGAFAEERLALERMSLARETSAVAGLGAHASEGSAGKEAVRDEAALLLQRRTAAQQRLAWFWQQERSLVELSGLVSHVNTSTQRLHAGILQDGETSEDLALTAGVFDGKVTDVDRSMEPDWRLCLASALLLVPGNTVFVAEGHMADDIAELCSLAPAGELAGAFGASDGGDIVAASVDPQILLGSFAGKSGLAAPIRVACQRRGA